MSNKIVLKKSSVASKVPLSSDLSYGELALNYQDGKLYFKDASNNIQHFLLNGPLASISQGNTSISILDSGTGSITTSVDGTTVSTASATGISLLGVPTAPTATAGTSTTQVATTQFAVTEALNKAVAMAIALG